MRWPWRRRPTPSAEVADARQRLEAIKADDARVDIVSERAGRILRENSLAPTIMRALGVTK